VAIDELSGAVGGQAGAALRVEAVYQYSHKNNKLGVSGEMAIINDGGLRGVWRLPDDA